MRVLWRYGRVFTQSRAGADPATVSCKPLGRYARLLSPQAIGTARLRLDQIDRTPIMSRFGFKELLADNWLEADSGMRAFVTFGPLDKPIPTTCRDLVAAILKPQLDEQTPKDVQALFEVARGAMLYGYFFYPLYTLAIAQLFRVGDAAVKHKCKALKAPLSCKSFNCQITWLAKNGVISADDSQSWHDIRKSRNVTSHSERHHISPPGLAIGYLEQVAQGINDLFVDGSKT